MKRKVDWDEEEESKREDYSDEESDEEEPRIKDVLDNLSQAVSIRFASELLHSMAGHFQRCLVLDTSWAITPTSALNSCDKHRRTSRICVRALNTLLGGLAELGVDEHLIKNKKLLSDFLEKEKDYRDNEGSENSANEEESSSSEGKEETASEKSQSQETENSNLEAERGRE